MPHTPSAAPAVPVPALAGDDVRARMRALNDEAWGLRQADAARSAELAGQALALAEAEDDPTAAALALRTLGRHRYAARADYDGAMEHLRRGLDLLDAAGRDDGRGDLLHGMANVHWRRGDHAEALRTGLEALRLHREAGDRDGEAAALNSLGNVVYHLGDFGQALDYYQASLRLREELGDELGAAYCLNNIGNIHGRLGEPRRALEFILRALEIKERGDPQAAGIALLNAGTACAELGDDARALEYIERAAERLRATGERDAEATCLRDIGGIHERRGDTAAALDCYLRSLEITRALGSRVFQAETLVRLGALRAALGDEDAGLAELHQGLEMATECGARVQAYSAHEALARAYERRGDAARALEHFQGFHRVWSEVFNAETNARVKSVLVRADVEGAQREAELLRLKNEELTEAYDRLRELDGEKDRLLARLREQAAELDRRTREDALTGLFNRRHLDQALALEWERAQRFGRELTVAIADIDHFKTVNDRWGHARGDEVLRVVGRILREQTRGVDVVARYGGEEFVLLLVETPPDKAARKCDKLRAAIEQHGWDVVAPGLRVTLSFGVAGERAPSPEALLAAADARLYAAKRDGRNRVRG
ncbi:MAG TPA: diguanylate cyclase [Longimicrobium sp.]|nr:diguanylate cyclase [Longimicrobium sp.]